MAEDNDLYYEHHLIKPLDPNLSMVFIRDSPDDLVVFPPINHENLKVSPSPICGYIESPSSESESPSSSSRLSASSSSSFSLLSPSDSDGQSPCERKSPSETEAKSPISPTSDSDGQSPTTARKSLYRGRGADDDVFGHWCELLLVRVNSKFKTLVAWLSTTLWSLYPAFAIGIWWWMRVRARRRRVNGETTNHLRDTIKEKDERIVKLLHQIAQMNELLIKRHKDIVSRR
ncbi:unnamed protein product [Cochlearia groenlandica]